MEEDTNQPLTPLGNERRSNPGQTNIMRNSDGESIVPTTPSWTDDTSLEDIAKQYTGIGGKYNDLVENAADNVGDRQVQLVGNDFGATNPYMFNTYYEPAATAFASEMRQQGTQKAVEVGLERAEEEARKRAAAAQERYNNALAAQKQREEAAKNAKVHVSETDLSKLPKGTTEQDLLNSAAFMNMSEKDQTDAYTAARIKELQQTQGNKGVTNWNIKEERNIATSKTKSAFPELFANWDSKTQAEKDEVWARKDVGNYWTEQYMIADFERRDKTGVLGQTMVAEFKDIKNDVNKVIAALRKNDISDLTKDDFRTTVVKLDAANASEHTLEGLKRSIDHSDIDRETKDDYRYILQSSMADKILDIYHGLANGSYQMNESGNIVNEKGGIVAGSNTKVNANGKTFSLPEISKKIYESFAGNVDNLENMSHPDWVGTIEYTGNVTVTPGEGLDTKQLADNAFNNAFHVDFSSLSDIMKLQEERPEDYEYLMNQASYIITSKEAPFGVIEDENQKFFINGKWWTAADEGSPISVGDLVFYSVDGTIKQDGDYNDQHLKKFIDLYNDIYTGKTEATDDKIKLLNDYYTAYQESVFASMALASKYGPQVDINVYSAVLANFEDADESKLEFFDPSDPEKKMSLSEIKGWFESFSEDQQYNGYVAIADRVRSLRGYYYIYGGDNFNELQAVTREQNGERTIGKKGKDANSSNMEMARQVEKLTDEQCLALNLYLDMKMKKGEISSDFFDNDEIQETDIMLTSAVTNLNGIFEAIGAMGAGVLGFITQNRDIQKDADKRFKDMTTLNADDNHNIFSKDGDRMIGNEYSLSVRQQQRANLNHLVDTTFNLEYFNPHNTVDPETGEVKDKDGNVIAFSDNTYFHKDAGKAGWDMAAGFAGFVGEMVLEAVVTHQASKSIAKFTGMLGRTTKGAKLLESANTAKQTVARYLTAEASKNGIQNAYRATKAIKQFNQIRKATNDAVTLTTLFSVTDEAFAKAIEVSAAKLTAASFIDEPGKIALKLTQGTSDNFVELGTKAAATRNEIIDFANGTITAADLSDDAAEVLLSVSAGGADNIDDAIRLANRFEETGAASALREAAATQNMLDNVAMNVDDVASTAGKKIGDYIRESLDEMFPMGGIPKSIAAKIDDISTSGIKRAAMNARVAEASGISATRIANLSDDTVKFLYDALTHGRVSGVDAIGNYVSNGKMFKAAGDIASGAIDFKKAAEAIVDMAERLGGNLGADDMLRILARNSTEKGALFKAFRSDAFWSERIRDWSRDILQGYYAPTLDQHFESDYTTIGEYITDPSQLLFGAVLDTTMHYAGKATSSLKLMRNEKKIDKLIKNIAAARGAENDSAALTKNLRKLNSLRLEADKLSDKVLDGKVSMERAQDAYSKVETAINNHLDDLTEHYDPSKALGFMNENIAQAGKSTTTLDRFKEFSGFGKSKVMEANELNRFLMRSNSSLEAFITGAEASKAKANYRFAATVKSCPTLQRIPDNVFQDSFVAAWDNKIGKKSFAAEFGDALERNKKGKYTSTINVSDKKAAKELLSRGYDFLWNAWTDEIVKRVDGTVNKRAVVSEMNYIKGRMLVPAMEMIDNGQNVRWNYFPLQGLFFNAADDTPVSLTGFFYGAGQHTMASNDLLNPLRQRDTMDIDSVVKSIKNGDTEYKRKLTKNEILRARETGDMVEYEMMPYNKKGFNPIYAYTAYMNAYDSNKYVADWINPIKYGNTVVADDSVLNASMSNSKVAKEAAAAKYRRSLENGYAASENVKLSPAEIRANIRAAEKIVSSKDVKAISKNNIELGVAKRKLRQTIFSSDQFNALSKYVDVENPSRAQIASIIKDDFDTLALDIEASANKNTVDIDGKKVKSINHSSLYNNEQSVQYRKIVDSLAKNKEVAKELVNAAEHTIDLDGVVVSYDAFNEKYYNAIGIMEQTKVSNARSERNAAIKVSNIKSRQERINASADWTQSQKAAWSGIAASTENIHGLDTVKEKAAPQARVTIAPGGSKNVVAHAQSVGGVPVTRVELDGSKYGYGNPFSTKKYPGVEKIVPTIAEAVEDYEKWLRGTDFTDFEQGRRNWILDHINSGALDGKELIYYTDKVDGGDYFGAKNTNHPRAWVEKADVNTDASSQMKNAKGAWAIMYDAGDGKPQVLKNIYTSDAKKPEVEIRPLDIDVEEYSQTENAPEAFEVMVGTKKSLNSVGKFTAVEAPKELKPLVTKYDADNAPNHAHVLAKLVNETAGTRQAVDAQAAGATKKFSMDMSDADIDSAFATFDQGGKISKETSDAYDAYKKAINAPDKEPVAGVTEAKGVAEKERLITLMNKDLSSQSTQAGTSVETFTGNWTAEDVKNSADKVFLFGDNIEDAKTGYRPKSTQAVIRGEENAIGIPTKKNRGTSAASYFTDADFNEFKAGVDSAIAKAKESGKTIVLPEKGIGTGAAQLQKRAPKCFQYLQGRLDSLSGTFEASTAGHKEFSPLNAKLKKGTKVYGVDVGGMSIEDAYQKILKGSGKNKKPSADSPIGKATNAAEIKSGKKLTTFDKERISQRYLNKLYDVWGEQNPTLKSQIEALPAGTKITDKFAKTGVSQSSALQRWVPKAAGEDLPWTRYSLYDISRVREPGAETKREISSIIYGLMADKYGDSKAKGHKTIKSSILKKEINHFAYEAYDKVMLGKTDWDGITALEVIKEFNDNGPNMELFTSPETYSQVKHLSQTLTSAKNNGGSLDSVMKDLAILSNPEVADGLGIPSDMRLRIREFYADLDKAYLNRESLANRAGSELDLDAPAGQDAISMEGEKLTYGEFLPDESDWQSSMQINADEEISPSSIGKQNYWTKDEWLKQYGKTARPADYGTEAQIARDKKIVELKNKIASNKRELESARKKLRMFETYKPRPIEAAERAKAKLGNANKKIYNLLSEADAVDKEITSIKKQISNIKNLNGTFRTELNSNDKKLIGLLEQKQAKLQKRLDDLIGPGLNTSGEIFDAKAQIGSGSPRSLYVLAGMRHADVDNTWNGKQIIRKSEAASDFSNPKYNSKLDYSRQIANLEASIADDNDALRKLIREDNSQKWRVKLLEQDQRDIARAEAEERARGRQIVKDAYPQSSKAEYKSLVGIPEIEWKKSGGEDVVYNTQKPLPERVSINTPEEHIQNANIVLSFMRGVDASAIPKDKLMAQALIRNYDYANMVKNAANLREVYSDVIEPNYQSLVKTINVQIEKMNKSLPDGKKITPLKLYSLDGSNNPLYGASDSAVARLMRAVERGDTTIDFDNVTYTLDEAKKLLDYGVESKGVIKEMNPDTIREFVKKHDIKLPEVAQGFLDTLDSTYKDFADGFLSPSSRASIDPNNKSIDAAVLSILNSNSGLTTKPIDFDFDAIGSYELGETPYISDTPFKFINNDGEQVDVRLVKDYGTGAEGTSGTASYWYEVTNNPEPGEPVIYERFDTEEELANYLKDVSAEDISYLVDNRGMTRPEGSTDRTTDWFYRERDDTDLSKLGPDFDDWQLRYDDSFDERKVDAEHNKTLLEPTNGTNPLIDHISNTIDEKAAISTKEIQDALYGSDGKPGYVDTFRRLTLDNGKRRLAVQTKYYDIVSALMLGAKEIGEGGHLNGDPRYKNAVLNQLKASRDAYIRELKKDPAIASAISSDEINNLFDETIYQLNKRFDSRQELVDALVENNPVYKAMKEDIDASNVKATGNNVVVNVNGNGIVMTSEGVDMAGRVSIADIRKATEIVAIDKKSNKVVRGVKNAYSDKKILSSMRDQFTDGYTKKTFISDATRDNQNKWLDNLVDVIKEQAGVAEIDESKVFVDKNVASLGQIYFGEGKNGWQERAYKLATSLSEFNKTMQDFHLAGGIGQYNAFTLRNAMTMMWQNPITGTRALFENFKNAKSNNSVMNFFMKNSDRMIKYAIDSGDYSIINRFSTVLSMRDELVGGGYFSSTTKAIMDAPTKIAENQSKISGLRHSFGDMYKEMFHNPTFTRWTTIANADLTLRNYDAAVKYVERMMNTYGLSDDDFKTLDNGRWGSKDQYIATLARLRTEMYWRPQDFLKAGFKADKYLDVQAAKRQKQTIESLRSMPMKTTAADAFRNFFFAVDYKIQMGTHPINGIGSLFASVYELPRLHSELAGHRSLNLAASRFSSRGNRNEAIVLIGIAAMAHAWNTAIGAPSAWSQLWNDDDQEGKTINTGISQSLTNFQDFFKFWMPNGDDGKFDPSKKANAFDPAFSTFTLWNSGGRAINDIVNPNAAHISWERNDFGLKDLQIGDYKAGRAIEGAMDELVGANLLSGYKAIYEVFTNNTYFGNNIWEQPYKPDGTVNPNYDPGRNFMASIAHILNLDGALEGKGITGIGSNKWVKGLDIDTIHWENGKYLGNAPKSKGLKIGKAGKWQDKTGTVSGSGLIQHEYTTALQAVDDGEYFDALTGAMELPFKSRSYAARAKTALNQEVALALRDAKREYDAKVANTTDIEAKNEAFAAFAKRAVDIVHDWSHQYGDVLGVNDELTASATKILMAFMADEYDDDLMYMQNMYVKLRQDLKMADGDQFLYSTEKMQAAIDAGIYSPEEAAELYNKHLTGLKEAQMREYKARLALEEAGINDDLATSVFDSTDFLETKVKAEDATISKQIYTEIKGKLESQIGEFKNFDEMKKYYEGLIAEAGTTKQKAKLANKYNEYVTDLMSPYIQKYGAAVFNNAYWDGDNVSEHFGKYIIIPADKYYTGKSPRSNYLKDLLHIGWRDGSALPSDKEIKEGLGRVAYALSTGKIASANSLVGRLLSQLASGKLHASKLDYYKLIRMRALMSSRSE